METEAVEAARTRFTSLIVQIKQMGLRLIEEVEKEFTSLIVQIKLAGIICSTPALSVYIPHSSDKTGNCKIPADSHNAVFTSLIVQIKRQSWFAKRTAIYKFTSLIVQIKREQQCLHKQCKW